MNELAKALEAALLFFAVAATVVSVIGIALARDAFVELIYGALPSGAALVALAACVGIERGIQVGTTQVVILALLSVPSSAIASHRIAAVVRGRNRNEASPAERANAADAQ